LKYLFLRQGAVHKRRLHKSQKIIFALAHPHFHHCLCGYFPGFLAMTWLQERADIEYNMWL